MGNGQKLFLIALVAPVKHSYTDQTTNPCTDPAGVFLLPAAQRLPDGVIAS